MQAAVARELKVLDHVSFLYRGASLIRKRSRWLLTQPARRQASVVLCKLYDKNFPEFTTQNQRNYYTKSLLLLVWLNREAIFVGRKAFIDTLELHGRPRWCCASCTTSSAASTSTLPARWSAPFSEQPIHPPTDNQTHTQTHNRSIKETNKQTKRERHAHKKNRQTKTKCIRKQTTAEASLLCPALTLPGFVIALVACSLAYVLAWFARTR